MLDEALPSIPSTTLSDFAVWKINDSDELKYETEFKPSFYPAASTAMGFPVSANRRKWGFFVLSFLFALAVLPFFVSPTVHTVDVPKPWANTNPAISRGLPNSPKRVNPRHQDKGYPAIADHATMSSGSMVAKFNYTAKYGLACVLLPVKVMSEVKRTVSHWIDWLREAFEESIYVDLE